MELRVIPYDLHFNFSARTSRGSMENREVFFLVLTHKLNMGIGEVAPLPGLSPETHEELFTLFEEINEKLKGLNHEQLESAMLDETYLSELPSSLSFGIEMAIKSFKAKSFHLPFVVSGIKPPRIPINGLVWMGDFDFMIHQAEEKLKAGFGCIKFKVGGIAFEEEKELIRYVRGKGGSRLQLRIDANGAFGVEEALEKLDILSQYQLHSCEQPIKQGDPEGMRKVIRMAKVPVALDEELIAIKIQDQEDFLKFLKPHFIVIKPSLHRGFSGTRSWIKNADASGIGWWMTSALESNLGLNAIVQFLSHWPNKGFQGLGTGALYSNNIPCPLQVQDGYLTMNQKKSWLKKVDLIRLLEGNSV